MKIISRILLAGFLLSFTSINSSAQEKASPVFKDGMAQIVPDFDDPDKWIVHDLWVETEFDSDGDGKPDRMYVDVTRPYQTDTEGLKLPVIYESSPYYMGTGSNNKDDFWNVRQELGEEPPVRMNPPEIRQQERKGYISKSQTRDWVPRGFIVVHSCSPGTGLSQGCPTIGGDNESLAPKAVIDWLNGRAKGYTTVDGDEAVEAYWTTGKTGMTGTSYNGTLPLAAATTGVEGLEAIIPISPNTSYYHYYRSNGLVRSPGGYLGEDVDVLYNFIHSGYPENREYCNTKIRDIEMNQNQDRVTGDYNEFWADRDYLNDLEPLRAAVLMSHGFNDWNVMPEHSNRISQALKAKGVPVQIYYHQAGHGGPPPIEMMNRWFTRYLFGIQNGVENDPKAWIVREDDNKPTPYKDYPNPDASEIILYPGAGAPGSGSLSTEKKIDQGNETLIDNVSFDGTTLAKAEWTNHRLLYLSKVLKEDIHISGTARITVKAASSKPAVNLSVWLVSLPWNDGRRAKITDNIITRGWTDLQNSKSLSKSKPLVPGKFYEMTFDLQPDDQVLKAGQQIGLMIFSSDREFTLWPDPGTELTIDLDGTSLTLPLVGGKSVFKKATE